MKTPESASALIVFIKEEPIELHQLLKFSGLAATGGEAKAAISEGEVLLNGVVETRKAKKILAGDKVTWKNRTLTVKVS